MRSAIDKRTDRSDLIDSSIPLVDGTTKIDHNTQHNELPRIVSSAMTPVQLMTPLLLIQLTAVIDDRNQGEGVAGVTLL